MKVYRTCMAQYEIYKNYPYFDGAEPSIMQMLADWVVESDRMLTF